MTLGKSYKGIILFFVLNSSAQVIKPVENLKKIDLVENKNIAFEEKQIDTNQIYLQNLIQAIEENNKLIETETKLKFSLPLENMDITSPYGYRIHPISGVYTHHNGVDLKANKQAVMAVLKSKVIKTGYDKRKGNYIILKSNLIIFKYYHLYTVIVKKNQIVEPGEIIGITGSTGYSTGEHLHFEILIDGEYVNPINVLIELNK